jgi:hypothetical protein
MKLIIKIIRKVKANLLRFKFHILFHPFSNILLTLVYISKLSRWAKETQMPEFNDFYSKNHNYNKRYSLYDYIIKSENLSEIYYIEFGVSKGHSFKWWIDNISDRNSKFIGFDTFTGLPSRSSLSATKTNQCRTNMCD